MDAVNGCIPRSFGNAGRGMEARAGRAASPEQQPPTAVPQLLPHLHSIALAAPGRPCGSI